MLRNVLSVFLVVLLLFSFVACGTAEDPTLTTNSASDFTDGLFPVTDSNPVTDSATPDTQSGSTAPSVSSQPPSIPQTETNSATDTGSSTDSAPSTSTHDKIEIDKPSVDTVTVEDVFGASDHYVGLTDQLNGRIIICDLEVEDWTNDNAVVWEYQNKSFKNIAGIKFRDSEYYGEKVVLFCYPVGGVILSYETKEILFQTSDIGWNPHSVELLPDGTFLVASSTDNRVDVFAPGKTASCQTLEFPNAHGVLWDPEYEVVWMVGMDQLSAYSVGGSKDSPKLSPLGGMTYKTPQAGMHDLAPVYGDPNALFVTCSAGIMKFDKEKERFNYTYPGSNYGRIATYAPGVGNFADGVFVFTSIESGKTVYQDWNTNEVRLYVPLGKTGGKTFTRRAPNDAYYKVRVLNFDYQ